MTTSSSDALVNLSSSRTQAAQGRVRPTLRALLLMLAASAWLCPLAAQSIRDVFESVNHAVVVVFTSQTEYVLGASAEITAASVGGIGAGVLIGPRQILTAAHVVQAADEVVVVFPSGDRVPARVIASRPSHDVALLELSRAATTTPVELGDSDGVFVGDQIFVVGAPLGQAFTLTVGYVSALRTSPDMLSGMSSMELIQTDAAINPGNSGGPMFNLAGEVVGVVSHILSVSGGSQGLGYAVSASSARKILLDEPALWSGLDGTAITGGLAILLNLPAPGGGILVQHIAAGSLADQIGLRPGVVPTKIGELEFLLGGDVIMKVQGIQLGQNLQNVDRALQAVAALPDGGTVSVTVLRGGVQVVLRTPVLR